MVVIGISCCQPEVHTYALAGPLHALSHALSGFGNKSSVVMIKQTFTFYLESSPIIPFVDTIQNPLGHIYNV